ncbi:MAG TPA: bifunctional phosphoribosyl-AMP cyclohydrolase/phosphoribosyl-ATP diphosphatase HisIE [Saprospiraceae bacterium]|nr:bifunctional phosphoribosyl-AMP cyclohydrolase/phosphoribosyl-ATP diphosphatase HisIE [Saprospiraceae bacterium]HPN71190.1 bifunctional phosphoribosyl-AMP cyclohydrolase/phosphoribosyl-ATP diphosphatase HisIE [Saprospiraceae bacterium]
MRALDIENIKYDAVSGLIPAIVQDCITGKVLMLGYMNRAAIDKTLEEGKVTFFSRSKDRLWTKGESSENYLILSEIAIDCDLDALLIKALPQGPTCHTGDDTCWQEENSNGNTAFLDYLEQVITDRKNNESDQSYTSSLFKKGINKIAQKVGEEAVEIVIEAKDNNDDLFLGEAADLLFHYLVLLQAKNFKLADVIKVLEGRHGK